LTRFRLAYRNDIEKLTQFKECVNIIEANKGYQIISNNRYFYGGGSLFANLFDYVSELISDVTRYSFERRKFDDVVLSNISMQNGWN
jgi:hypothetical protein